MLVPRECTVVLLGVNAMPFDEPVRLDTVQCGVLLELSIVDGLRQPSLRLIPWQAGLLVLRPPRVAFPDAGELSTSCVAYSSRCSTWRVARLWIACGVCGLGSRAWAASDVIL